MVLRVLVSGLLEHDSGKTWTVVALARALAEKGPRVAIFKPVAGHNLWGSPHALRSSYDRGLLLGNDVYTYLRYLEGVDPGVSNPVALALAYPDPLAFKGPSQYLAAISDTRSMLVLARVQDCGRGAARHYVFPNSLARLTGTLRSEVERLAARLGAEPSEPGWLLDWLAGPKAEELLEECRARLEAGATYYWWSRSTTLLRPTGAW
ncbi:hypothetical protein [Pyrodictium occultum]|uniref:hypothetical protein n=1 Tax=Pyrodictium occultum TaxID=2309 RepID=UPI00071E940D|nr:hypothetical protein [Pyrodictium occultum]